MRRCPLLPDVHPAILHGAARSYIPLRQLRHLEHHSQPNDEHNDRQKVLNLPTSHFASHHSPRGAPLLWNLK